MECTAAGYHKITSYDRRDMEPHALDWPHQPSVYKVYPETKTVGLEDIDGLYVRSLDAVCLPAGRGTLTGVINPMDLSKILLLAGGLTGRQHQAGQDFYYRSAPSAGALYPNEIYIAWWGGAGLENGIYHFDVHNRRLNLLRPGNFQPILRSATNDASPDLAAVFMITGIFFRSAWKYRKRAYRYVLLDAGHLMENLRLALNAAEIPSAQTWDVDDAVLDHLLGVDTDREGILGCMQVYGRGPAKDGGEPAAVDALPESIQAASRVSDAEIVYPEIVEIHAAGRIVVSGALSGSDADMMAGMGVTPESWQLLGPQPLDAGGGNDKGSGAGTSPAMDYAEAVVRRRSRRNFTDRPMRRSELVYLLDLLCRAVKGPGPAHDRSYASSVVTGFLAGNMEGMDSGFYLLDPVRRRFGRVVAGSLTHAMSAVCLDQAWLSQAAVHFLFLTRLSDLDSLWGGRGYRYAMMTAGRLGQVVYLGATALGLGCCGIGALYDHEARALLGLNPKSALLYLVAAGPVKSFGRNR